MCGLIPTAGSNPALSAKHDRARKGPFCFPTLQNAPNRSSPPKRCNSSRNTGFKEPLAENCIHIYSSSEWLGLKMRKLFKGWICLGLTLGLLAGGLPAQASEVVKLARLVVSGKRSTSETPRSAPAEPRSGGSQTQGMGGGGDDTGTAPTPQRGVS